MAQCLVTGGAGFIGSHLVDELISRKHKVVVIDNLSTGNKKYLNSRCKFYRLDVRRLEKIKPLFKGVDWVFHLAAFPRVQPSIENPLLCNDINLNGTLNVLVAARDVGVKKFVYSASSSAYGNKKTMPLDEGMKAEPISPYALQKYVGELYCRLFSDIYQLPTVSLRYFNVYGDRQSLAGAYCSVIGTFIRQRLAKRPMTIIGDGNQLRDFTNVLDVVRANILAAETGKVGKGEVINIGRGVNHSVQEVAKMIGGPVVFLPPRLEPRESLADNSLAKKLLGWEPTVDLSHWLTLYKKSLGLQ
jgi:UDP-glucose 4-epimerase